MIDIMVDCIKREKVVQVVASAHAHSIIIRQDLDVLLKIKHSDNILICIDDAGKMIYNNLNTVKKR